MSLVETTRMPGDAVVGRNLDVGADLEIHGNATVEHNLRVYGWIEADNVKGPNKGIFTTKSALLSEYPNPKSGWFAGVGTTSPFTLYLVEGGQWVTKGGQLNVNVDMEAIDTIQGSVTQVSTSLTATTNKTATLKEQVDALVGIIDAMAGADKLKTITVVSSDTTKGTVSGGGTHAQGVSIVISATPKSGNSFVRWSDGSTQAERAVTVTENATYTATFSTTEYVISAKSDNVNMGTTTGTGRYQHDAVVSVVATPKTGYTFVGWYNGSTKVSSSATYTFKAAGALNLIAKFEANTYLVSAKPNDTTKGSVSGEGNYHYGDAVKLTATPNYGNKFSGWYNGTQLLSTESIYTFTLTGEVSLTAKFEALDLGAYDYYVGWTNNVDANVFASLTDQALKALVTGKRKAQYPTYSSAFQGKVFIMLYRSTCTPSKGWLNKDSQLPTEFAAADFTNTSKWSYVHGDIVIDAVTYKVVGYGDNMMDSSDTIEVQFN